MVSELEMKGYLRFLILWLIDKQPLSGVKIACEIEKRKGSKPSPGTIYPALKELKSMGLIEDMQNPERDKMYILTTKGKEELEKNCDTFCRTFYDLAERMENSRVIE